MKKLFSFITILSLVILFVINVQAQIIESNSTKDKLISYGIDPENLAQVIDSLNTDDDYKRLWIINWVGERKIYEAIPKLKLLFHHPNTTRFPQYRNMEQKSKILRAVEELEDTSFQLEFREELDSLSKNDFNYFNIMLFAAYLQKTHNDSYGWQYVKKFYEPEYAQTTTIPFFSVMVYALKPFLNSVYLEEVVYILRNFATHDYIALDYLAEINDPETEQLAINMSLYHSKSFSRYRANEILKYINIVSYITTLQASLNTVSDNRIDIYSGLLRTGQPSVYKYVVDLFNSNVYPADSSIIQQELENQWLLFPNKSVSINNLLDSLSSALFQFNSFGWLGDLNFVNELDSYVLNSKLFFVSNDTINAENQLKLMREKIDFELRDTTDLTNKFVKLEAWKYLYPRTYFIERSINRKQYTDTLISIDPTSVVAGSPTITAHIVGSGFGYGTLLFWNDNYYLDYSIISPTEIMVVVPDSFLSEPGENKINASNYLSYSTNRLSLYVLQSTVVDISVITPEMSMKNQPGAFTMELWGSGFNSSSVVYFNGNARATTYVSESTVTAQILSSDVSAAGSFPVWVSDGTSNSDTLVFKVVNNLPNEILPIMNCVTNNGNGTYTAYFGYNNKNSVSVFVPVYAQNKISPDPWDRGQPGVFKVGVQEKVFSVTWSSGNIIWHLNNKIATAKRTSPPCP